MRMSVLAGLVLAVAVFSASAQTPLGDDVYVLTGASVPAVAKTSGALKYTSKSAPWPTGRVSVLTFTKAGGGVMHPITDETLLYVLSGSAQVDVGGKAETLGAGDVASFPSGSLRNAGAAADAVIVTWTVPSLTGEKTPTVVRAASVKAPTEGPIRAQRYEFPGNSVRAVRLMAGANTNKASAKTDSLIYVTAGGMKFNQNGKTFDVVPGDFIREIAGLEHFWNVPADSGFVTTSGLPKGMASIDPGQATDRR
jgi:quercetin dioxygenase-like cupin family protein